MRLRRALVSVHDKSNLEHFVQSLQALEVEVVATSGTAEHLKQKGILVTTAPDLARFVRGLWSQRILDPEGLEQLTRWTPEASFAPESGLRYERYGLGMGLNVIEGVELLGHTGFIGSFAFHAPEYDAVVVGTHNASHVDRWPLVGALCRELRGVA